VQKDVALQQNFLINAQPFWCPVVFYTDLLSRRFFLNASSALFKAYRDFSKL
jgi:hypothetical protein